MEIILADSVHRIIFFAETRGKKTNISHIVRYPIILRKNRFGEFEILLEVDASTTALGLLQSKETIFSIQIDLKTQVTYTVMSSINLSNEASSLERVPVILRPVKVLGLL